MKKAPINKISDKLSRVASAYTIRRFDNGFLLEIEGRVKGEWGEYLTVKIMAPTIEQLAELMKEAAQMPFMRPDENSTDHF